MNIYFGMDGKPISMDEWTRQFESKTRIVKQDTLKNGYFVSTVWLGLDHSFGRHTSPLIFETMVFKNDAPLNDVDMDRYPDIETARAGHEAMVRKWNNKS